MVDINNFLSKEEDELLGEIHDRVCEELRELIEDYLLAVKEEVDTTNILKDIQLLYKDINLSLRLPEERQEQFETVIEKDAR